MNVDLRQGDCVELMAAMPDCLVDSVVTDPPYELGFMGKSWDGAGIAYSVTMWAEALRVLKPGGHLLAFGGTRTYHRMACAIEDAGFEIRDSIHWVYGSGFPKSLDVAKAIDKSDAAREQQARRYRFTEWVRSTGLTSAQIDEATGTNMGGHYTTAASQPAIMTVEHLDAVRHLIGEVPEWVEAECRKRSVESKNFAAREVVGQREVPVGHSFAGPVYGGDSSSREVNVTAAATDEAKRWEGWGTALKPAHEPVVVARKPLSGTVAGNVLEWGTGGLNIDGCRVGTTVETWPASRNYSAREMSRPGSTLAEDAETQATGPAPSGRWPANVVFDRAAGEALDQQSGVSKDGVAVNRNRPQEGSTYDATSWHIRKPPSADVTYGGSGGASRFFTQADFGPDDWPFVYQAKPSRKERNAGLDGTNGHPTVKPVALMRHLVRLVTPPGGTVLDPFAGSGTTLVAAVLEGMNAVGCEMTEEYLPIIQGRVAWAQEQVEAREGAAANPEQPTLL